VPDTAPEAESTAQNLAETVLLACGFFHQIEDIDYNGVVFETKTDLPDMRNVLSKLLPAFIKRPIAAHIRAVVDTERSNFQRQYFQSHPRENAYCVKPNVLGCEGLPVPPEELWVGYGPDAQSYVSFGKSDVADMARILEGSGVALLNTNRVLEFGCAAGRMLRHVPEFAPKAELWGVDISAQHIQWCVDNLTPALPAMHFATTTMIPHLPFEDRYFDLVFCGSVFTHIEDIQQSWLLELGRVLRPSGRLFITIHDEHTVRLLDTSARDRVLAKAMREQPVYTSNKDNFNMIVVGRGAASQVFYNSRYFKTILPPCLRWVSHTSEAYGYQSAVLLEKLRTD
jgi:ubiquinone/menaquinone biosynthesis C-methylase UbiE